MLIQRPDLSSDRDQSHVSEIFPDFPADVTSSVTWFALPLCPGRMFRDTSGCGGECGCAAWPPRCRWASSCSCFTGAPGSPSSPAAARALCLWPMFCSWRWEIKWIPSFGLARLVARRENYATGFWIDLWSNFFSSLRPPPCCHFFFRCDLPWQVSSFDSVTFIHIRCTI